MRLDLAPRFAWFRISAVAAIIACACSGKAPHAPRASDASVQLDSGGRRANGSPGDAGRALADAHVSSQVPATDAGRTRDAAVAKLDAATASRDAAHDDGGVPLTCSDRATGARQAFLAARMKADRYCFQDRDCVLVDTQPSCVTSCGGGVTVSQTGKQQIEAAASTAENACADLNARGCSVEAVSCAASVPGVPLCIDMQCRRAAECPGCAPECNLPLEIGTTNNMPPTYPYMHDPLSGTCVRGFYAGSGGNANRFATLVQCMMKCPPPKTCPGDRELRSVCVDCNVTCVDRRNVCNLVCNVDEDCQDEIIDSHWCIAGICDPGGHVCE